MLTSDFFVRARLHMTPLMRCLMILSITSSLLASQERCKWQFFIRPAIVFQCKSSCFFRIHSFCMLTDILFFTINRQKFYRYLSLVPCTTGIFINAMTIFYPFTNRLLLFLCHGCVLCIFFVLFFQHFLYFF